MPDTLSFETYFFDLDGTIFLGDILLPGVQETLCHLRSLNKQVRFLSNTTIRTRRECRDRLLQLGLAAHEEEIVTAGFMSAAYFLESRGAVRVLVAGEQALRDELAAVGVEMTDDPVQASHVLVGMDREFDYGKLHRAMKAVRNGARLIAANPDPNCPVAGDLIPDTWSMVKAIEAASMGAVGEVIGKPSAYFAAKVLEWSGTSGDRCLMVGDRLDTDIVFGASHGMRTALVLTGVASLGDLEQFPVMPDYVWTTLDELLGQAERT
ncbi:HAD-IIA family hydrolase [Paenibacillus macerans]|uniref:HAD-IIA family hydrolase n=1 Tax=Paenibacillus macerans TaxID=44252 RepID=UPI00203A756C|nr:HAD-IIA family hydrolase [Paenibacillus macerans]MCM3703157.1 HAD-IIA family hydrolase [Paenibacillus macerans]